jgi:hypothetical protein
MQVAPKIIIRDGVRYRVFTQAWVMNPCTYLDAKCCYTDNAISHLFQIPVNWINDRLIKVSRFEARLWKIPEGSVIPRYTVTYLIFLMNRFINYSSTHISQC